jgi:hypothetical protein
MGVLKDTPFVGRNVSQLKREILWMGLKAKKRRAVRRRVARHRARQKKGGCCLTVPIFDAVSHELWLRDLGLLPEFSEASRANMEVATALALAQLVTRYNASSDDAP